MITRGNVSFVDGSKQMKMVFITKKDSNILRNDFVKTLKRAHPRSEATFRTLLYNHHLVRKEKKIMKNSLHRTIGTSDGERCGGRNIEVLTASMFSGTLMGRRTPVLRLVTAVFLNVVTHVTIYFRSVTRANGAKLKQFCKVRWAQITKHPIEKIVLNGLKARSPLFQHNARQDKIL